MNGCAIGIGQNFDLGLCVRSTVLSWLPEWAWQLAPYWPVLAAIIAIGVAWRFAGVPGIAAVSAIIGFILGRRSTDDGRNPEIPAKDQIVPPRRRK